MNDPIGGFLGIDACYSSISEHCLRVDIERVLQWIITKTETVSTAVICSKPRDGVFPLVKLPPGSGLISRSDRRIQWTDKDSLIIRRIIFITDPMEYPRGIPGVDCVVVREPYQKWNIHLLQDLVVPCLLMMDPSVPITVIMCMSRREFMGRGLQMNLATEIEKRQKKAELQAEIKKRRGFIIPEAEEKVYYFASPYSHPSKEVVVERYERVILAAWELITKKKYTLIEPIAMSHEKATRYEMPTDFVFWGKMDKLLISKTDGVIVCMLEGWQESKGVTQEIAFAKERGLPVFYYCPTSSKFVTKDEQSTSE